MPKNSVIFVLQTIDCSKISWCVPNKNADLLLKNWIIGYPNTSTGTSNYIELFIMLYGEVVISGFLEKSIFTALAV